MNSPSSFTWKAALGIVLLCCLLLTVDALRPPKSPTRLVPKEAEVTATLAQASVPDGGINREVEHIDSASPTEELESLRDDNPLKVRVKLLSGNPVSEIDVVVVDLESQLGTLGRTNNQGIASFSNSPSAGYAIAKSGQLVSEPTFFDFLGEHKSPLVVNVVLPSHRKVVGTVSDYLGRPMPEARVIAVPVSMGFSVDALAEQISNGTWLGAEATSDEFGRFEIAIPSNQSVSLVSGVAGYAQDAGKYPISLPNQPNPIEVVLTPAYGVLAKFQLEGLSGEWDWSVFSGAMYPSFPIQVRAPSRVSLALSGISEIRSGFRSWPYLSVLTLVEQDLNVLDASASLRGEIPGFESFDVQLPIRRLREILNAEVIQLRDKTAGRGSLSVSFLGMARPDLVATNRDRSRGTVYLSSDGENPLSAPIWDLYSGPVSIRGIPSGRYRVFFRDNVRTQIGSPEWVDIQGESEAKVSIGFPDVGSIELDLRLESGNEFLGKATSVVIGPLGSEASREFRYWHSGRPYVLDLLPQGEYLLEIHPTGAETINLRLNATALHKKTLPVYVSGKAH